MRGIPNKPVKCRACGIDRGCAKDSLCHSCRIRRRPNARKRFFWTPELEARLRRLYADARSRSDLTGHLNHFERLTGFSRVVITTRARELGLGYVSRRVWTEGELEFLQEHAGSLSHSAIARRLRRSYYSVKARAAILGLRLRISEGYSQEDLRHLLGVGNAQIRKWIQSGWLKTKCGRVPEASVRAFLKQHPEKYKLSRLDEAWYKGLLFPSFGGWRPPKATTRPSAEISIDSILDAATNEMAI